MEMKTRLLFVPLLFALVASLAACGGSSNSVPANAVAVVDGTPITLAKFNFWLAQDVAQKKATTGVAPDPVTLRAEVVALLVQFEEVKQQAKKLHVSVTPAEVDKYISDIVKKTPFNGSMSKFLVQLKQQGLTLKGAQEEVSQGLLQQKIRTKVTSAATVTVAQEKTYYDANKSQFMTSATLQVAKSKSLAVSIEQQLRNGTSFAKLAKKYSKDPGSASQGGKYTATSREVPAYDKAAFSLKTGQLSGLVDATSAANGGYGFFIMKPLGPVKTTTSGKTRDMEHILVSVKTTPKQKTFAQAQASIKSTLLGQQQSTLFQKWISDLVTSYKGKISYQTGYAPPTTTAISTTPPITTG